MATAAWAKCEVRETGRGGREAGGKEREDEGSREAIAYDPSTSNQNDLN